MRDEREGTEEKESLKNTVGGGVGGGGVGGGVGRGGGDGYATVGVNTFPSSRASRRKRERDSK